MRNGAEAQQRVPLDGREPSDIDMAYFAGLFDGEGSIDVINRRSPRLKISMTDGPTIAWLKATFGGKVYYEKPSGSAVKDAWKWNLLPQADIRYVLERAMPFLVTKVDRARATLKVLDYYATSTQAQYQDSHWFLNLQDLVEQVLARHWPQRVCPSDMIDGTGGKAQPL